MDPGTHRTEVQGDPEIEPCLIISLRKLWRRIQFLACLLRRVYRECIGSKGDEAQNFQLQEFLKMHTKPYEIARVETHDDIQPFW